MANPPQYLPEFADDHGMTTYFLIGATEYRRTYPSRRSFSAFGFFDRTMAFDEVVTAAIAATADYIANHATQEAIPLATQNANYLLTIPEPTAVPGGSQT